MKTNIWKITTLVLAALLVVIVGRQIAVRTAAAEPQPHMQAALDFLGKAQAELEAASPDKGGHRVKAIALTKKAIVETKKGIAYDDRR